MPSQLLSTFVDVLKQALPAHAVGIHFEAVTVAAIEIRIEDDGEHVVGVEGLPLPQDSAA